MLNREILLSVAVPVYNVEQYLNRCVDSILNQTYAHLELILVNDGSTDRSGEICEDYAKLDARVQVIHQENSGAALARRRAAERAAGEYIVFIDSDDYIDEDYLEKMVCAVNGYDLVTSGYCYDQGPGVFDKIEQGIYATSTQMEYIIDNMIIYQYGRESGLTAYIFNKLYRTDYARKVFAEINPKVYWGEDSEFLYRYILHCQSIYVTDICGYHYCTREQSIVHRRHTDYLRNLNELYLSLEKVFREHDRKEILLFKLQLWIITMIRIAPSVMGFSDSAQISIQFLFPHYDTMRRKEIILYGAGSVGKDFYLQLRYRGDIKVVGWVDKNAEAYQKKSYPVMPLSEIDKLKYDYIIIAVNRSAIMEQIKKELIEGGIPEEKIVWKRAAQLIL